MAKKSRSRSRGGGAAVASGLDLAVQWGNANFGPDSVSIGIRIARGSLSVTKAVDNFVGKRVTATIIAKPEGWEPDQQALGGMEDDITIGDVTFDVKSIAVGRKSFGCTLKFALSDIDVTEFVKFARRAGRIQIGEVGELPEEKRGPKPSETPAGEDDDHGSGDVD